MPPNRSDVLKLCELVAEQENLKVTFRESLKGGMYAFAGAFVGAVIAGPVGMGVGGTAGSIFAACNAQRFKSVAQIIQEDMTERQKNELSDAMLRVLQGFDSTDVYTILTILAGSPDLKMLVVDVITKYLTNEMRYQLA